MELFRENAGKKAGKKAEKKAGEKAGIIVFLLSYKSSL